MVSAIAVACPRGQRTRTNARTRRAAQGCGGTERNKTERSIWPSLLPITLRSVRKKVRKTCRMALPTHASFNNTIITITDRQGNALSWASSGGQGFRVRVNRPRLPPGRL